MEPKKSVLHYNVQIIKKEKYGAIFSRIFTVFLKIK
jgi:hypothetical protein